MEQLAIAWLAFQLVEKPGLVVGRDRVIGGLNTIPSHPHSLTRRLTTCQEMGSAFERPRHRLGVRTARGRSTVKTVDRLGLVGLTNSGKSALFNALTGGEALVAAHPFSTIETEVGVAHVPDPRVDALSAMSQSRKIVYAGFEVVDIAAIGKGSEKGDTLGGRFLAGVREVDAICLVLRSFEDENVPGETDPLAALSVLELELVLADVATLEQQLTKKRSRVAPSIPR